MRSVWDLRDAIRTTRTESDHMTSRLRSLEERLVLLETRIVVTLASSQPPRSPSAIHEAARDSDILDRQREPSAGEPSPGDVPAGIPVTRPPYARPQTTGKTPTRSAHAFGGAAELRFGQRGLLIIGIIITILAVGYFLKYSFDRNWVGPAGRVALAYLGGLVMFTVGDTMRRRRFDLFGLYLIGGSMAVFYFAGYAGYHFYGLFHQPVAFGLMVVVTACACAFALAYNTKWLAVLGIVGGFLTPIVLSTNVDNQVALMSYMAILNGGILTIAGFKQWRLLNQLGATFTWLLFSAWFVRHYADGKFWPTTLFLNLFFLIYACAPFAFYLMRRRAGSVVGFAITIPNAFVAFGYSYVTIKSAHGLESVGIATVAYAALFFAMACYLRRINRDNLDAFVLMIAKGLLFLIVTVPIVFSEHWITVFWAIQAAVLIWASLRLNHTALRTAAVVALMLVQGKLVLADYPTIFDFRFPAMEFARGFEEMIVERWSTVGMTLGAAFLAARMFQAAGFGSVSGRDNFSALFYGAFAVNLFIILNFELGAYFHEAMPGARFAAISVLWSLFAAALIIIGFARNNAWIRRVSIALFAVTVVKVFVRDMANVETPYRILSFLVVGLLLVGASYLYHRFAARILAGTNDTAE